MSKSDLRARPIFHHTKDAIEAHLTIVFAALAISRRLQDQTGMSIKKVVRAPSDPADHHHHRRPPHRGRPPHRRRPRHPHRHRPPARDTLNSHDSGRSRCRQPTSLWG